MSNCKLSWLMTVCASLLMMCSGVVYAQDAHQEKYTTLQFEISFARNRSAVDIHFSNNSQQMENLEELIKGISTIQEITIYSNSSPDGKLWRNTQLAQLRGQAVESTLIALIEKYGIELNDKIKTVMLPEDWQGLQKLVEQQYTRADKQQLQQILSSSKSNFTKKQQMMALSGGQSFNALMDEIMPQLRKSVVITIAIPSHLKDKTFEPLPQMEPQPQQLAQTSPKEQIKAVGYKYTYAEDAKPADLKSADAKAAKATAGAANVTEIITPAVKESNFFMALKSNLLYDALITPNIGVEFCIGKDYSVQGNWMYAWWKSDPSAWYHRTYGGDISVRRWIGKKHLSRPLTGWHAGVYGQILTYDFIWGKRGYLGDRWSWAAGVEGGYSKAIGKKLNIDFSLNFGYLTGLYHEYIPQDGCYVWQATKQRRWIGPTKAEISLVWLLGKR